MSSNSGPPPPPLPPPPPPILNTQIAFHRTLTDFLTIAIHSILYTRELYPQSTFITARAYNLPVHQNRHPLVCGWVNSSIDALKPLLAKNTVKRVVIAIYAPNSEVLERFIFDISRFPVVDDKEKYTEFDGERGMGNVVDINEQLRHTIQKLEYTGSKMKPLPAHCTYTLAVELRDEAEPPIGHPQPWVPSEPSLQTGETGGSERIGSDLGGVKCMPVRLVESGDFILESWIEEGAAKLEYDGL